MNKNQYIYIVWIEYGNQYISHEKLGGTFSTRVKARSFRQYIWDTNKLESRIEKYLVDAYAQV